MYSKNEQSNYTKTITFENYLSYFSLSKTHFDTADDQTIWQAFVKGDDQAYICLYERYYRILFSYGKKVINNEVVVEDSIQDLFIDLWRTRSRLNETPEIKFYLFRSLRRKIHRSISADNLLMDSLEFFKEDILPIELPIETHIINAENSQEQIGKLKIWVNQLPSRQKEVLILRFYHDFDYEEIAKILEIKEQTVRNFIQIALQKLRGMALIWLVLALR